MTVVVLIIAVVNLGLGFGAALYLGQGPHIDRLWWLLPASAGTIVLDAPLPGTAQTPDTAQGPGAAPANAAAPAGTSEAGSAQPTTQEHSDSSAEDVADNIDSPSPDDDKTASVETLAAADLATAVERELLAPDQKSPAAFAGTLAQDEPLVTQTESPGEMGGPEFGSAVAPSAPHEQQRRDGTLHGEDGSEDAKTPRQIETPADASATDASAAGAPPQLDEPPTAERSGASSGEPVEEEADSHTGSPIQSSDELGDRTPSDDTYANELLNSERVATSDDPELLSSPRRSSAAPPDDNPPRRTGGALSSDDLEASSLRQVTGFAREALDSHYGDLLLLDSQVRELVPAPTVEGLTQCARGIQQANERFLDRHATAKQVLPEGSARTPQFGNVLPPDLVRRALEAHEEEVRDAVARLDSIAVNEENLAAGCQRLLAETDRLVQGCHAARDALDEMDEEFASADRQQSAADEDSDISGRAYLRAELTRWKATDRQLPMCVAMIDVDDLQSINARFGPLVGDRLLKGLETILDSVRHEKEKARHFAGQRFLLVLRDVNAQEAAEAVEHIRQTVQQCRFEREEDRLSVTVSCAVVEAVEADTDESVLERIDHALQEAKRYGRNRTFVHEGQYPTPVVPPDFSIESRVLPV